MPTKKKQKKKEEINFHIPGWIMILLVLLFIILMYDMLFGISFPKTKYVVREDLQLEIPKYMSVSNIEEQEIRFETYRSMAAISKDMKKIRKNYERISCSDQVYYYNQEGNYSIAYQIDRGLLVNYLKVKYQVGKANCPEFKEPEAEISSTCKFRRTYLVDLIKPSDSKETIYVTLSKYQGETETVELPNIWSDTLEPSKNYIFTFEQVGNKKTNIDTTTSIFSSYVVSNIEPTTLIGMEQVEEPLCK